MAALSGCRCVLVELHHTPLWYFVKHEVRAPISQAQVSRLASGRTRDPGSRTIRALCDGLGIPRRFAGLAEDEGGEDTDRREFLTATIGVAASAVLAPSDDDHEQLVRITTQSYRTIEQTTPSPSSGPTARHADQQTCYNGTELAQGQTS